MTRRDYIAKKARVLGDTLEELLPSYQPGNGNPISRCQGLPSESEVLRVLALLDDVFFPGYREAFRTDEPLETLLVERLDEAYDILYRQIKRALPYRWESEFARQQGGVPALSAAEIEREAERITGEFFCRLPRIRELLKRDVIAAYRGDPAARSYEEVILSYPAIRAVATHRVAHELYRLEVPIIPRLMNEWVHRRTGIDIHPGAEIGESFFIDHGTGVVIGETTQIGHRVKIYQGVTLGARSFPVDDDGILVKGQKRHPTIEDDVVIYPGATILGGDTVIGRGSIIGANTWITRSVPAHSKVTRRPGNE